MKRIQIMLSIAAAALLAGSCVKEMTEGIATEAKPVTVCINATSGEGEKLTLDPDALTFSWEAGDSLAIYQASSANSALGKSIAGQSGSAVAFSGTIATYAESEGLFAYTPYSTALEPSTTNSIHAIIATTQTGTLADFGKYHHAYGRAKNVVFDETAGTLTCDVTLKSCTPVLKFSIPSGNDVRKVEITAKDSDGNDAGLCGEAIYKPKVASSKQLVYTGPNKTKLTISRDGDEISGDVYACLAITCTSHYGDYDDEADAYINRAKTITFTFYNRLGQTSTKTVSLKSFTKAGYIKNLGSVGTISYPKGDIPGVLTFRTDKTDPYLILTNLPEGTTCKYEIGKKGAVSEVSASSATFDPEEGINLREDYAEWYVRILATNPYFNDTQFNARIRNWETYKGSSLGAAYSASGLDFKTDTGSFVTNGLTVSQETASSDFSIGTAYLTMTKSGPKLSFNTAYTGKAMGFATIASVTDGNTKSIILKNVTTGESMGTKSTSSTSASVAIWDPKDITAGDEIQCYTTSNKIRLYRLTYMEITDAEFPDHTVSIDELALPDTNEDNVWYTGTATLDDPARVQGGLKYSTDGGSTWTDVATSTTFDGYKFKAQATGAIPAGAALKAYVTIDGVEKASRDFEMPGMQLVLDFTGTECPLVEASNGDFPTTDSAIAKGQSAPPVEYKLRGTDYIFTFSSFEQTGDRAYAYKWDGGCLMSYKLKLVPPTIEGRTTIGAFAKTEGTKKYLIYSKGSKKEQDPSADGIHYWYRPVDYYGSQSNSEKTYKLVISYSK